MPDKVYSLIIPTLNRLEGLKLLYRSISSTNNIKILLIDNGSNKETTDFIEQISQDQRVFVTFDKFNKGAAYARNAGLHFAFDGLKSEGIFFIDSDVVLGKDCLDEMIAFQSKNGGAVIFSQDQRIEGFSFREFLASDFKPTFKKEAPHTSECCFMPKETYKAVGYFDEMFYPVYCEDMDYFYRIKLKGGKLLNCQTANHYHLGSNLLKEEDEFTGYKQRRFALLEEYYKYKWGGEPTQEKFKKRFNSDWEGFPRI